MEHIKQRVLFSVVILLSVSFLECQMSDSNYVREGTLDTNDAHLYYKIFGTGDPVIILHGGPGFDHIHMLPMKKLANHYQVIFYDQRGTGRSIGQLDTNAITVENFVDDLELLRTKLRFDKFHLIGHSWGAILGMHYGIKYPENLKTMILLAASGNADMFGEYFKNIDERTLPEDKSAIMRIEKSEAFRKRDGGVLREYFELAVKPMFADPAHVNRLDLTFSRNTALNQQIISTLLMQNLGNFDILEKLKNITCPSLIVHGDSDPLPWKAPYNIHQHMPQSKLVFLENCGHFMFIETPEKLFTLIRKFLNNHETVETVIPVDIQAKMKENISS